MRDCLIAIGCLLWISTSWVQAQPTESTSSWVYPYLCELRLRSSSQRFFVGTGPYERQAIASYVESLEPHDERGQWLKHILMKELRYRDRDTTDDYVISDLTLGSSIETRASTCLSAALRFALYSGRDLSLWTVFRTSVNGAQLHKIDTRPWKEHARASFDAGGLSFRHGRLSIFVGRDELSWGMDRTRGLLLSGSAPAFDMVKLTFKTRRFLYTAFSSRLRRGEEDCWEGSMRRYVAGHRLEAALLPSLNLGVAEAVIYGGENRSFEPAYLNPITILYAEQWNLRQDDNVLISADFTWKVSSWLEARGEVMIDDFQYDFESEANKYAFGLAVSGLNPVDHYQSLVGLSYFQVRPHTYNHKLDYNRFSQEGSILGYPEGPDCDRLSLWLTRPLLADLHFAFDLTYGRKGEGTTADSEEDSPRGFLSGVVEKRTQIRCHLIWHPSNLHLDAGVEWYTTTNADNIEGTSDSGFRMGISATANFNDILSEVWTR